MIRFVLLLAGLLMPELVGCAAREQFLPVEGSVHLEGKPLAQGSISFTPLGAGRSAGTEIRDGAFVLTPRDGLSPGRYRVEITAFESTGLTVVDEDLAGREEAELRQIIPERYNARSSLEVTLESEGENRLRFELTSGPA